MSRAVVAAAPTPPYLLSLRTFLLLLGLGRRVAGRAGTCTVRVVRCSLGVLRLCVNSNCVARLWWSRRAGENAESMAWEAFEEAFQQDVSPLFPLFLLCSLFPLFILSLSLFVLSSGCLKKPTSFSCRFLVIFLWFETVFGRQRVSFAGYTLQSWQEQVMRAHRTRQPRRF